jgi:hypothetical protein
MSISIPAFHVSDRSAVRGKAEVFISRRKDSVSSGVFRIEISVQFDPASNDYPIGSLQITSDLSDGAKGAFKATSIELINSHGKHSPTVHLTGRCVGSRELRGLRYWLLICDNTRPGRKDETPDIVSFAIHDRKGDRVAYGSGPVRRGDLLVTPK